MHYSRFGIAFFSISILYQKTFAETTLCRVLTKAPILYCHKRADAKRLANVRVELIRL